MHKGLSDISLNPAPVAEVYDVLLPWAGVYCDIEPRQTNLVHYYGKMFLIKSQNASFISKGIIELNTRAILKYNHIVTSPSAP